MVESQLPAFGVVGRSGRRSRGGLRRSRRRASAAAPHRSVRRSETREERAPDRRLRRLERVGLGDLERRDLLGGARFRVGRPREQPVDDRVADLVLAERRVDRRRRPGSRRVVDVGDVGVVDARLDDVLELAEGPDVDVVDLRERRARRARGPPRRRRARTSSPRNSSARRRSSPCSSVNAAAARCAVSREPRDAPSTGTTRSGAGRSGRSAPCSRSGAAVDVEPRERRLQREGRTGLWPIGDVRRKNSSVGMPLLEDRRRVERLASLEAQVQASPSRSSASGSARERICRAEFRAKFRSKSCRYSSSE